MSWSTSGRVKSASEVEGLTLQDYGDQSVDVREQFQLAKGIANNLIASGVVGKGSKEFIVTLSGHANPGHEPRAGYANDAITVTVSQAG